MSTGNDWPINRPDYSRDNGFERTAAQSAGTDSFGTLDGAQAHHRGRLRLCAGARRARQGELPFERSCLFRSQGRPCFDRRRDLARYRVAYQAQARSRPRSGDHRPPHDLSRPLAVSDRGRDAGAGRPRRADGAARGAPQEIHRRGLVRRGAQAAAALSADGDRRHHLADRRRDPRYLASPRRPLSAPRAGLAGEGAGRRLGGRGRGRHRGVQRACPLPILARKRGTEGGDCGGPIC